MATAAISPTLIVHGGAGPLSPDRERACVTGCEKAAQAGLAALLAGQPALDAVMDTVRALELDPNFNAGVGAALTRAGTVETDAGLMDGRDLRFGAVAAVPNGGRAIELARAVLDDGEHVLLCGDAVWELVADLRRDIAPSSEHELITERSRAKLAHAVARRVADPGTVGACAIDRDGHVAAATSTGGMTYKRRGRIGDTPLCGCGTYADDRLGAASATGVGEGIIRITMARACIDRLHGDGHPDLAAATAVDELRDRVGGSGGIIVIDRLGRVGADHNTEAMPVAVARHTGQTSWVAAWPRVSGGLAELLANSQG